MRIPSIAFLMLLTVIGAVVLVLLVLRYRSPARTSGGSLIEAFRIVFSAPAFFVPAAMTFASTGILMYLSGRGGSNPFLDANTSMIPPAALAISGLTAAGLAGHVGLLEALRDGKKPGPDGFLRGVKRHTVTFFVAKLLLAGLTYMIAQDIRNRMMWHSELWLPFVIPSVVLAPVIAATSLRPGNPVGAILMALGILVRNPVKVAIIFALQFGVLLASIIALDSLAWHVSEMRLIHIAAFNASSLDFMLFPTIWFATDECAFFVTLVAMMMSTMFLTAYWTVGNGALLTQYGGSATIGPRGTMSHENDSMSSDGRHPSTGTSNPDAAAR